MQNKNKLTCRQFGDYLIPILTLPPEEANIQLGKWGMLHKDFLRKHKPVVFATLLAQCKLWQYLAEIGTQAKQMFDILVKQMKECEDITEQLKEKDQIEWLCLIENIEVRAKENINHELIFT